MFRKKGTAHAVFDPEFNKSFTIFHKYYNILKEIITQEKFKYFFLVLFYLMTLD